MRSTEHVMGLDLRITLQSSCSDSGQNESRTEDEHKSEHWTDEEEVCWWVYISYFANKIIIENTRKLARRVGSRKSRTPLTGTKPIIDTDKLFAGGVIGYRSKEKSGLGFMDNGGNKAFCSRVYLTTNRVKTASKFTMTTNRDTTPSRVYLTTSRVKTASKFTMTTNRDTTPSRVYLTTNRVKTASKFTMTTNRDTTPSRVYLTTNRVKTAGKFTMTTNRDTTPSRASWPSKEVIHLISSSWQQGQNTRHV